MRNLSASRSLRRMDGVTLVELMIAMTLGLVIIAAVGWVYLGTTQTYRTQDALSRMQEGARYAFELISNDLRMAGATGCGNDTRVNVVNNLTTNWYANLFEQPLVSLERDNNPGIREYSDALRIVRADVSREYIVQTHDAGASQFNVGTHDIAAGDILLATDCTHAAVFQASAAASPTVSHGASGTPGNAFADLGVGAAYTFLNGSRLYKLNGVTYYVAQNPAGELALYRARPVGATATVTAEELVEGVEDIQFAFAVDTDAAPDGAPNFVDPDGDGDPYLRADQVISGAVPGATAQDKWGRVVSVRVSLLLRTVEDNVVPGSTPQRYTYNGATVDAPDRRLRTVFTHVVNLRNR